MCLECVWSVFGVCLGCVWGVFGKCSGRVWDVFGSFGECFGVFGSVWEQQRSSIAVLLRGSGGWPAEGTAPGRLGSFFL